MIKILDISKKCGAELIYRPKHLSQDNSSELNAWKHAVNYLERKMKNLIILYHYPVPHH